MKSILLPLPLVAAITPLAAQDKVIGGPMVVNERYASDYSDFPQAAPNEAAWPLYDVAKPPEGITRKVLSTENFKARPIEPRGQCWAPGRNLKSEMPISSFPWTRKPNLPWVKSRPGSVNVSSTFHSSPTRTFCTTRSGVTSI